MPEKDQPAYAAEGKRMLKLTITFTAQQVKSKYKALNCASNVIYEANKLEPDALFQGNLPEPNPTAAVLRMGFPRGDIPSVDVRCLNAKYTFHFRDANTMMFNLNNVIYAEAAVNADSSPTFVTCGPFSALLFLAVVRLPQYN